MVTSWYVQKEIKDLFGGTCYQLMNITTVKHKTEDEFTIQISKITKKQSNVRLKWHEKRQDYSSKDFRQ